MLGYYGQGYYGQYAGRSVPIVFQTFATELEGLEGRVLDVLLTVETVGFNALTTTMVVTLEGLGQPRGVNTVPFRFVMAQRADRLANFEAQEGDGANLLAAVSVEVLRGFGSIAHPQFVVWVESRSATPVFFLRLLPVEVLAGPVLRGQEQVEATKQLVEARLASAEAHAGTYLVAVATAEALEGRETATPVNTETVQQLSPTPTIPVEAVSLLTELHAANMEANTGAYKLVPTTLEELEGLTPGFGTVSEAVQVLRELRTSNTEALSGLGESAVFPAPLEQLRGVHSLGDLNVETTTGAWYVLLAPDKVFVLVALKQVDVELDFTPDGEIVLDAEVGDDAVVVVHRLSEAELTVVTDQAFDLTAVRLLKKL